MDIVSIKKFLRPETPKAADYIRLLQLLLKGISTEAVDAGEQELASFRKEVAGISQQLSIQSTAEEIESAAGFVLRAAAGYKGMTSRMTKAHVQELQGMLAMMTKTIAFLSDSSKTGVEQLRVVEKNLQTASTIQDVRVLRGKLNDCLTLVRKESHRLHEESTATIQELQRGVEKTATYVREAGAAPQTVPVLQKEARRAVPSDDPLTGLPDRDAAEALIACHIQPGSQFFVTLFLVDHFAHLNGRYGTETGNDVLLRVAEYLGKQLEAGSLFRWSGPAFAAVVDGAHALHEVEQQMHRIGSRRFEKTIEEDRRTVLLPITCSCMVQRVSDGDSLEEVVAVLDDFVAAKAGDGAG